MMCRGFLFHSAVAAHVSVSAEAQALSLQSLWQSQPNQTGLCLTQPQYEKKMFHSVFCFGKTHKTTRVAHTW